jgi:hypothetical protein
LGTQDEEKQNKKHNTIYITHHYTLINVNKTWALLQTTGSKDELNIVSLDCKGSWMVNLLSNLYLKATHLYVSQINPKWFKYLKIDIYSNEQTFYIFSLNMVWNLINSQILCYLVQIKSMFNWIFDNAINTTSHMFCYY